MPNKKNEHTLRIKDNLGKEKAVDNLTLTYTYITLALDFLFHAWLLKISSAANQHLGNTVLD